MDVCLINLWDKGGMLHYSAQLANHLSHLAGVSVSIVLPSSTPLSTVSLLFEPAVNIRYANVPTEISPRQIARLPWQVIQFPYFIAKVVGLRPDVIHATAAHVWLIPALPLLARLFPIVSTLHDVAPHPGLDDTIRKRLEIRTLVRFSHSLFVHSSALKEALLARNRFIESERVHVIPHGEYAFFTRWCTGRPEEPGTILFFGRIRQYKGLSYLLDAFSHVCEAVSEAKLVIAGEGPLGELEERVRRLPNCEVHNRFIADDEVSAFFERASIVVCPYIEASQSGVVPIAYAFRKPIVATCVGGLPDIVEDGKTGLLVPPCDSLALAKAIIILLQDAQLRAYMGQNAYRKMKNELGWEEVAKTTLRVYREVVRDKLSRGF